MPMSSLRFLFVLTNADRIGPNHRATGYEFSEVAHPYLALVADGHRVDFASPLGGQPPEDGYDGPDPASALARARHAAEGPNPRARLDAVDLAPYDGLFFPGGLGPMVDLLHDPTTKTAIATFIDSGRVVGAVCHGPVALLNVTLADGSSLLAGRQVAAFTTAEEIGHSENDVPFLLDIALTKAGASHTCATPFAAHVVVDGPLVTGQNPASAAGVAQAMIGCITST